MPPPTPKSLPRLCPFEPACQSASGTWVQVVSETEVYGHTGNRTLQKEASSKNSPTKSCGILSIIQ